ncbi:MAG: hypothetical protein COV74_10875 [Candidatus Omnitrophica bacterium CG11_big_fil_rev_8_21_14_0_20_45_26]|uniref:ACT domain-containing protein n=1 Tax=Candidatus Abzuiibacterium crystallinum TaxID=1974748 RepID=A0A2H0LKZ8_9BACT|nr:MAG: hypothetical protein COV74_10875 [Candidatus Omnitrophica bacterium CG11_big_fil_rev_8_21_14_0_20_45_26]PIW63831.1 MAG: hypothetical protein COW12_07935 [Candidatus Omnitrophica bacterium CG12_big_fil_rev_8_21_14_0_65_45_16]
MARAQVGKELHFETPNETGVLGRVTLALAEEDVYIVHLSAYTVGDKGYFQIVTRDNEKAKKAISYFVKNIVERDILIVEFENKVGTLAPVVKLLGNENIGINYVYGTSGDGFKIVGVFSTENNQKAAELINQDSGTLS